MRSLHAPMTMLLLACALLAGAATCAGQSAFILPGISPWSRQEGQAKVGGESTGGFECDAPFSFDESLEDGSGYAAGPRNGVRRLSGGGNGGLKLAGERQITSTFPPSQIFFDAHGAHILS
jgi:hypothetical protein